MQAVCLCCRGQGGGAEPASDQLPSLAHRLFAFAAEGKAEELSQLLTSGEVKSIKVLDSKGRTALNIAISEEHLNVAQVGEGERVFRVGRGAEEWRGLVARPRMPGPFPTQALLAFDATCLDQPDSGGDTALHCAADVSNTKILAYLLDLHPHLDYQNLNSR